MDYTQVLKRQRLNSQKPGLNEFYRHMYKKINDVFYGEDRVLEIGAGAGISEDFCYGFPVHKTDITEQPGKNIEGGVNVMSLPFRDESFSGVFAVDTIHHLTDPYLGINEMLRVTKSGGSVALVEPFLSPFSKWVYKFFHGEKVSFRLDPEGLRDLVGAEPEDGDQGILQFLMASQFFHLNLISPQRIAYVSKHEVFAPFSFFATGGINSPLPTPRRLVRLLIFVESKLPLKVRNFFGARHLLVLHKL